MSGAATHWRSVPESAHRPPAIRWWRGIRFELAGALACTAVTVVMVFGLLAARTAYGDERNHRREESVAVLQAAAAAYAFSEHVSTGVCLDRRDVPAIVIRALRAGTIATWDDGTSLWAVVSVAGDHVLSQQTPDAPLIQRWQRLRADLARIAALVAVVASAAGWIIADRLSRRLRVASRAAQQVAGGNLSRRVPVDGSDEITALGAAVNAMAETLVERIEHERALTADAAHELRTPLTALVSAGELLDDSPASRRVRHLTTRLRRVVDDLLRLAQLENGIALAQLQPIELDRLVLDAVDSSAQCNQCKVTIDAPSRVRVDVDGARRALGNLVANAAHHGRPPIDVTVTGSTVVISDHGPGFPAELLSQGPRRFHPHGATGRSGLGLTIVTRELSAMQATLALTNTAAGCEARITFSEADTP